MNIFIHRDGLNYGPYTPDQISVLIKENRASLDDRAWHEGMEDWDRLSKVLGVAPAVSALPGDVRSISESDCDARVRYYHVSPTKFTILWLCTGGVYGFVWFYKNWRFVRSRDQSNISPLLRCIFSAVTCYALAFDILKSHKNKSIAGPLLIALCYFGMLCTHRLPDPYWLPSLFAFLPLLVLVSEINRINRAESVVSSYYSRFKAWQICLCVIAGGVMCMGVVISTGVLPDSEIVEGAKLHNSDRSYLAKNRIVANGEAIHFFYTDGFWSIADGGNLVTATGVVSYSRDPQTKKHVVRRADYRDIKDVQVKYSQSFGDDTEITIVTGENEDDSFVVSVSKSSGRDHQMVDKLMELWHAARGRPSSH